MRLHPTDVLYRLAILTTVFLYSSGYATVGLVLLLLAVAVDAAVSRRLPWHRSALDPFLALFVGSFLLSGFLSEHRAMAVGSTGLAALTIYLAFGAVHGTVRRDPAFVRPVVTAWLVGGGVAGLWAILRHLQSGVPATTGALGQNAIGTTMIVTTVAGLGVALYTRSRFRYAAGVIVVISAIAMLYSYTRGAWLGTLAGVALLAWSSVGLSGGRRVLAGLGTLALAVLLGAALVGAERTVLAERARTTLDASVNRDRIFLLRAGLAIVRDHPLLGTGLNTFPFVYAQYRLPGDEKPADARPNAHNIYVNMAAEGGLLGAGAFLAGILAAIRYGALWARADVSAEERGLRAAILAALVGILIHQLFDGTLISVHLGAGMWMLMALLLSGER